MQRGADADFDAFVRREHDGLRRLARLLEEDPHDADAVLRTSLARVRRTWRRLARGGDPAAAARAAIVGQVLTRRPSDGRRISGWVDEFEAAWEADDSGELRRALSGLPVRMRTATVLSCWAGLPVAEIARLLGDGPDVVQAEVTAGAARLGAVLAPARSSWHVGAPTAGPLPAEDLARRLGALAEDGVPAEHASVLAETARRDTRTVRGRWLAGTVAACAAVAVAVPVTTGSEPASEPAARTDRPTRSTPALPVDVTALPPRGSLAGDEAFLAELRGLRWESPAEWGLPPEHVPRPEDRRVLFAGDVPGGRWALVVGPPAPTGPGRGRGPVFAGEVVMAWLTGPPGARPAGMVLSSYPHPVGQGVVPSLVDPRTGTMVVLAAPGDVVEVSTRPEVGEDGSRSRTWERIVTEDGVAVARVEPTGLPWLWSVAYRVGRDEPGATTVTSGIPDVLATGSEARMPPVAVRYRQGRPPAGQRQLAEDAARTVLTQLGLSPDDVEVTALVTATLPAPSSGQLALIGVRVPSGAVVLTGSWSHAMHDGSIATMGECGTDVRPAGARVAQRVVAAACEVWDPATGDPEGTVLVVSAPPSVAAVRTYDGDGDYLGEHPVRDGRLVVPMTTGATEVEAVTADGVLLGRSDLLPTGTWLGE